MVKPKPKLKRKGLMPPSMLALVIAVLTVTTMIATASAHFANLSRIETTKQSKTNIVSAAPVKANTEPQNASEVKVAAVTPEPPKVDPNNCEAQGMHYRADNNECIPKPVAVAGVPGGGSGSCQAEIAKYDWNHSVATAVMIAESGGDPGQLNDNPATGDYSVGCFQVNIYGANAASRPSEAALKNAATNVEFAYRIYKGNGASFIGQWGVCRSKVSCY